MIDHFGDAERGGFFSTAADHEAADRAAQGRRRQPDPVRQQRRRARPAAPRRADRRSATTSASAAGVFAPPRRARRSATPRPSPTCCARSTSTSRRSARWHWSATTAPSSPRSSAPIFRPHVVLAGGPEGAEPPLLRERTGGRRARRLRVRALHLPPPSPPLGGGSTVLAGCALDDEARPRPRRLTRADPRAQLDRRCASWQDRDPVSGSFFTFPAGRRAKWIVFAVWFVAIFVAAGPANLPGKFEDAESNEATSYLPGDAESTAALKATESLQDGEIAPAVIVYRRDSGLTAADRLTIVDYVDKMAAKRFPGVDPPTAPPPPRAADSRPPPSRRRNRPASRPCCGGLTTQRPRPAGRLRPVRRADLLGRRQSGDRHRLHQGQRRGRTDRRPGQVLARTDREPADDGLEVEDHRRRRLLGRRDRSLRRHQRHPAAGRASAW